MQEALGKYVRLAGFQSRNRWAVVLVLAVIVSAVEALGALLVYLLLGIVTAVEESLVLPALGDVTRLLPGDDRRSILLSAATLIGVFFLLRAVLVVGQRYVSARITENAGARLSARLADGYLAMPYTFHLRRNSSELIRNAYATVEDIVRDVFRPAVRIISESLIVLAILVVLLVSAPLATALAVGVLLPSAAVLLRFVYPRLLQLGIQKQAVSRASLQSLQQSLQGVRDIKVLGRERVFSDEFRRQRDRMARVYYLREVFREIPNIALETLIVLLIAGLFGVAVLFEGEAVGAVPLLGLFGYAAIRLKPSLTEVVQGINLIRFSHGGVDDLTADLEVIENVRTSPSGAVRPLPFDRDIVFEGVSFRYEGAGLDALRDVNLRIAKGESIGIVGPTGGGKTTLVDVIIGLLEPTSGVVRVDGVDIRGRSAEWQQNVGIVPQSLFLIDDSLRNNIALGRADDEIDDDRIMTAIELAQLAPVVAELPEGLDTVVGEGGIRLSGGQRQRVAIARALLRRPDVLVFDEGTSALDMRTEGHLLDALARLRSEHTLITVAHRLATVRVCDRVVLVEAGRIVDTGRLEDLARRNPQLRTAVS